MSYLIRVDETYRADSEAEATRLIDEAKKDGRYELSKYTSVRKESKLKGEVVDSWWRVTLTKIFDSEKEPIGSTSITYSNSSSYDTEGSAF